MSEIVIVEGPDGSGKSTLIANHFSDFQVVHNGVFNSPEDAYLAYAAQLSILEDSEKIVFDRMHISQDIYGPICRNEPRKLKSHRAIETLLYYREAVVVLCYTNQSHKNWQERNRGNGEYIRDLDRYLEIFSEYHFDKIGEHTSLPFILYDYTVDENWDIKGRINQIRKQFYGH